MKNIVFFIIVIVGVYFILVKQEDEKQPQKVVQKQQQKQVVKKEQPKEQIKQQSKEIVQKEKPKPVVKKDIVEKIKNISLYSGNNTSGDVVGNLKDARYSYPTKLFVNNGKLYIVDEGNQNIKLIDKNKVSVIQPHEKRKFSKKIKPIKIQKISAAYATNNNIYIVNFWKNSIFELDENGLFIKKYKAKRDMQFNRPLDIKVKNGNLYVVDTNSNKIKIINSKGVVSNYIGKDKYGYTDGVLTTALLHKPSKMIYDDKKENIYLIDNSFKSIRVITNDKVSTLKIKELKNKTIDTITYGKKSLYIYSNETNRLYKYNLKTKKLITYKYDLSKKIEKVSDICFYKNSIIVSDSVNNSLFKISFF